MIWHHLRHWSLHVVLSAAASFVFATRDLWHNAQGVAGMLAGVVVFVALYTWVWSSGWFRRRVPPGSAAERALLYGTRVRSFLGLLALAGVLLGDRLEAFVFRFTPDFWSGVAAYSLVLAIGRSPAVRSLRIAVAGDDPAVRAHNVFVGDCNSLLPTFLITATEGLLLTALLLAISWFCRVLMGVYIYFYPTPRRAGWEF